MAYRPDTDRASGVHCGWGRRISFKIGGNLIYDCFFYYVGEQLESLIGKGKSPAQQAAGARILLKADVSEARSDSQIIAAPGISPSITERPFADRP